MWLNIILVVIAIAILVFVYLYAQPSKSREQFALNVEQDYRQTIVTSFNTVLGRDPQEYEVQMYRDYMTSPYDTTSVTSRLQKSTEFKKVVETYAAGPSLSVAAVVDDSTADQTVKSMDLAKRLEIYRSVLSIYEKNLERLPSMVELNYYTAKLATDKTFTLDKIALIIQSSKEYTILKKNQTNTVNAELEGSITDAQLTLMVNEIYTSMFNGERPSKVFEDFIKAKFVEYKMNEQKFKKMLTMLNEIDKEATLVPAAATTATANAVATATQVQQAQQVPQTAIANTVATATQAPQAPQAPQAQQTQAPQAPQAPVTTAPPTTADAPQAQATQTPTATAAPAATSTTAPPPAAASNEVAPATGDCKNTSLSHSHDSLSCYNKNKVFDSLYANIQNAEAFLCKNVTSTNSSTYGDQNKYAELQAARNKSELKYECSRNQFAPYEYDPNVVPNLKNTKFGTFLDDANNTSVGSIMPQFIFKEYGPDFI
jgi:FtsZ-interacting cell division protein ZipA